MNVLKIFFLFSLALALLPSPTEALIYTPSILEKLLNLLELTNTYTTTTIATTQPPTITPRPVNTIIKNLLDRFASIFGPLKITTQQSTTTSQTQSSTTEQVLSTSSGQLTSTTAITTTTTLSLLQKLAALLQKIVRTTTTTTTTTSGTTTTTTTSPVNCYALYVRLQTLNELLISISSSKVRFTSNLAAATEVLLDAQTKRSQETNETVQAAWDEWIALILKERDFFVIRMNHANTIFDEFTVQKAQVESDMTKYCGGFQNAPAFDLNGFLSSVDQRFVMLNRTIHIFAQIVDHIIPSGKEGGEILVKNQVLAYDFFNLLNTHYQILVDDITDGVAAYAQEFSKHVTILEGLMKFYYKLMQDWQAQ